MLNEYSATSDWRLGIILEARDTILDALILPLVTPSGPPLSVSGTFHFFGS
jgi:hypothetical protein